MSKFDLLKMAFKNLAKRKLRTGLTIMSVVIGAVSIIIMVSLGVALNENFDRQIQEIGGITKVEVQSDGTTLLTDEDMKKIKQIQGVETLTPVIQSELNIAIQNGKYVGNFRVLGIDPSTLEAFDYNLIDGRTLNDSDNGTYNVVINPLIQSSFYKKGKAQPYPMWISSEEELPPDAEKHELLDEKIKISTDRYNGVSRNEIPTDIDKSQSHKTYNGKVIGIAEKPGKYDSPYVILPLKTLEAIAKDLDKINAGSLGNQPTNNKKGYNTVWVKAKDLDSVEGIMKEIKELGNFYVYSSAEYIENSKKTGFIIQALLGAIGGVSLFISAIGITNTMVMSIYERTKEIGIMKVIGARVSDIKSLFLIEASLIGFLGGLLGVVFSLLLSVGLNALAPYVLGSLSMGMGETSAKISSVPIWLAGFALIFTSLIGLVAGYLPAKRAVKIEPLKAIKSE